MVQVNKATSGTFIIVVEPLDQEIGEINEVRESRATYFKDQNFERNGRVPLLRGTKVYCKKLFIYILYRTIIF